ncbi:protein of unknown function (DUF1767) domain containing protein [Elaphomyces granulatus]
MSNPQEHIKNHLLTAKCLSVSQPWLSSFLASTSQQQQRAPLSALTQTALFRLLASDFTRSLSTSVPSALLPVDISNPAVKERRVPGPVPVQVLDIEDIGVSLWSQVEAIERVERGETLKGKEIVRVVNVGGEDDGNEQQQQQQPAPGGPSSDDDDPTAAAVPDANGNRDNNNTMANADLGLSGATHGPHRLVLQDAAGTRVVAFELKPVEGVAIGKLPIGAKLLLRDATVGRGMVLLSPESVTLLGGKIEAMDAAWRKERKANLLARLAEMETQPARER